MGVELIESIREDHYDQNVVLMLNECALDINNFISHRHFLIIMFDYNFIHNMYENVCHKHEIHGRVLLMTANGNNSQ